MFVVFISKVKSQEIKIKNIKETNDEMIKKNNKINDRKKKEINDYKKFLNLTDRPKKLNDPLIEKEKKLILNKYSKNIGFNVKSGLNIYLDMKFSFGNQLLVFNKLIFYCEIIRCKKIILQKHNNIYINHTLHDKKYNITIEVSKKDDNNFGKFDMDFEFDNGVVDEANVIVDEADNKEYQYLNQLDSYFYYNIYNFRLENKFYIFKKEILKNLPKIKTNKNDLYIHIRGSDIFKNKNPDFAPDYAQPPLCFYQKIINTFKFRKIIIISKDKENPVIDELLTRYKNIMYKSNSIEKDISYLSYAYNIVGSISSFLISIIKLNNNLKYFWEYDRYPISLGNPHLHHSLYNYKRKYTIFKMKPSKVYDDKMIIWEDSEEQLRIMLNDICPYNFTIVKPNL